MNKQFICTLLLVSMLTSLAACGGSGTQGGTDGTTASETTVAAQDPTHDSNGFLLDKLDPTLDFGGKTFNLLCREGIFADEYSVEEQTGDIVDDALFERNNTIEERLNIDLNYIAMPGEWADRNNFNGAITQSVLAGDGAFDLCAVLSNQLATLTMAGVLTDMNGLNHLSFDSPWWNASLLSELSVDDKLYFASGDASLGLIKGMLCFYYNKQMIEDFKLGNMYEIVESEQWTLDKLNDMVKNVYSDLNGNSSADIGDRFGLAFGSRVHMYGFLDSFKMEIVERDKDGIPSTIVFGNERNTNIVQKLFPMFQDNDAYSKHFVEDESVKEAFSAGRLLFCTGEFGYTSTFRDIQSFDFGVIPYPKYDENQDGYGTTARATYSSFCIPLTAPNPDMSAAVLECYASESYRKVTPAYFETALKVKYSRDDETSQMFDLIKNSVRFSFATSYTMELNDPQNSFRNQFSSFNTDWASYIASWKPVAEEKLANVIKTLNELA